MIVSTALSGLFLIAIGLALHILGLLLGLVYGPTLPHRRHWLHRP